MIFCQKGGGPETEPLASFPEKQIARYYLTLRSWASISSVVVMILELA
jgi:hypothetical protein